MKMRMATLAFATLVLLYSAPARAGTLSGQLWIVPENALDNTISPFTGGATFANIPARAADVTFSVDFTTNTLLSFDSTRVAPNANGYTIGGFLTDGGAYNIVENVHSPLFPSTLTSIADNSRSLNQNPPGYAYGAILEFTGSVNVANGQTINSTHDDGITLYIGPNPATSSSTSVISAPGPTSADTSTGTYAGASGLQNLTLLYDECCGPPGILNLSLVPPTNPPPPTPEPGTWLLFASGLAGLFGYGWRRGLRQTA